jgi:ATP-dependent protease ClpP protease subunit
MTVVIGGGTAPIALPEFEGEWQKEVPYLVDGLTVVIEYLAGDTRTKTRKDGARVSGTMPCAYGRILGTTDRHGEEIDVYLSSSSDIATSIYVIDQTCIEDQGFDEHKVMVGFASIDDAISTYIEVFNDKLGGRRLGAITTFPKDEFLTWLHGEGNVQQPSSKYVQEGVISKTMAGIAIPRSGGGFSPKYIDETGGVQIPLPDMSNGPKILVHVNEAGGNDYIMHLFSVIDTAYWTNTFDRVVRTLDLATDKDVLKIYISSPGGSVFLMGRLVSAIKRTNAKVITYAQGSVASAATAIWAEGHERHILPGAFFMQHMSSQFMSGKTTQIAAKTDFCQKYIAGQLKRLEEIGLFTAQEVSDMIYKSADVFISGREAIARVGNVSTTKPATPA